MTAKEHYDNHLGNFYDWMISDFDTNQKTEQDFFEFNQVIPFGHKIAIDLGAGHGLQSISLAQLGYKVKAFDFNRQLIELLNKRIGKLAIESNQSDLNAVNLASYQPKLIVCMGDTIAYLVSFDDLKTLIANSYGALAHHGQLILSFRDQSQELIETKRFIPIRSDDKRVLTCILDYSANHVMVTDQLYEKSKGKWEQKVSTYKKLRLTSDLVKTYLKKAGFKIISEDELNRMIYVIAEKKN